LHQQNEIKDQVDALEAKYNALIGLADAMASNPSVENDAFCIYRQWRKPQDDE